MQALRPQATFQNLGEKKVVFHSKVISFSEKDFFSNIVLVCAQKYNQTDYSAE